MSSISPQQLNAASAEDFAEILRGPRDRAAAWLRTAAEGGVVEAQAVYAQMLLDGDGVAADPEQAVYWFKRASDANHAMAMNMLGQCHRHGWGVAQNLVLAAYWYRLAAQRGLDWGMYNHATALALGEGVQADRQEALAWFERAAGLGHAKSINILGGFHEDGWGGLPADKEQAYAYYLRAAEGGDFRGQFNIARLLIERGEIDAALPWLDRIPDTATAAFLAKAASFLAESGDDRLRAKAHELRRQALARGAFA
ncbi:Putative beta-lactamase HcpC precursor [Pigmentiphaga humi]|uniref:Beta-lactamase HcpC n=1 Tax=Pigmentiphaga humi TaxID=2478468 RepID=A0A3P4B0K1_9BURK|nr:tetratricopeptide repeat protein [Pigmentiphaga humi]VCU69827.1 Putative beta-lactamase HcpC precursor [Pigmentiphaga humi]